MKSIFALIMVLLFGFPGPGKKSNEPAPKTGTIAWMGLEEAEMACRKNPRKVVIDVYTNWCGWCKKMDQTTFRDSLVQAYIADNFYAVKLNAEEKNNLIFKEKVYRYNPAMQANDIAISFLNGQMSYPTLVFLDEKMQPVTTFGGYADARQFDMLLHYVGENAYRKKKSLDEFNKEFRSRK